MSGDSTRNGTSSNGNGRHGASSGTPGTPQIRDFVYLNQERIFSYLSQLDGGLKLLYSRVRDEGWSETMTSPEKTTDVGANASGSVEGKMAFLAGVTGELGADWKHSVRTGGDSRSDFERRGAMDLFGLHHRAFDLVMERLGGRFTTVQGRIFLLEANWLEKKVKDFPEIAKAVNAFTTDKVTPPANTTQMSYLFRAYLADKVLVIMKTDDGKTATAYLDPSHFTYPISNIIADYGQAPTLKFTLVGISAPPQQIEDAGNFAVPHFHVDAAPMAALLAHFAGALGNMRDYFEVKSVESHLVPLGLYYEL